jgi:hypothetical protein
MEKKKKIFFHTTKNPTQNNKEKEPENSVGAPTKERSQPRTLKILCGKLSEGTQGTIDF